MRDRYTTTRGTILSTIMSNQMVKSYVEQSDKYLEAAGYTEHGLRHAEFTAQMSGEIITCLGYPFKDAELASIAGFLHDIGNFMGRENHGIAGALLVQPILLSLGMSPIEVACVMGAIANHEEEKLTPADSISAAVVIADKADVHRSRVRSTKFIDFDVHDRVNHAATDSKLNIDPEEKTITLSLSIDTEISPVMEYFEIFLSRMVICQKAAIVLGCKFQLIINDTRLV
ncbi:phosphohydrolase [bacterium (candidate division B38) B3_B38]|nr:MAG: phosphohydrolase [bacterium (candidate division B38) B3_B38]